MRIRNKAYVDFETLIAYWLKEPDDSSYSKYKTYARNIFESAADLFNGTQTYTDIDGTIHNYPNLNITQEDLLNHYFEEYGERLVARPLEVGRISIVTGERMDTKEAMSVIMDITYRRVQKFVKFNTYKYLTLAKTTGFTYNPIENYRMVEEGTDNRTTEGTESNIKTGSITETPNGSEDLTHTINSRDVGHISISGPVTSYTTTTDSNGQLKITEVSINDRDRSNVETTARSSGTNAGGTIGSVSTGQELSATIGTSGIPVETRNYTTTYDDDTDGRLKDYSVTSGTTGSAELESKTNTDTELMTGTIESGTPNAYGYTDSKTFNNRTNETTYNSVTDSGTNNSKDSNIHKLTRSGNIGVTTSQQMIQSERDLANFNIIDLFCRELNKEILLGVYDRGVPLEFLKLH